LNRLFVELYLDEDVDVLLAELLRNHGFLATTARSAEQLHITDAEQLEYAVSQGMALLTHNRDDFEALARQ
jgi:predicted nuclease of predicted toxin-antitoxin system